MIARTRAELGADAPVIITGGLAPLFVGASPLFDHYDPNLTLDGLHLIYERIAAQSDQQSAASMAGEPRGA
jgi:type III pantothenate kinase